MTTLDPALGVALRGALALLLGSAAAHKLRDRARFARVVAEYGLLPEPITGGVALALAGLELALAAGLAVPAVAGRAALAAAALFALYGAAIAINLARGRREIDCGCGASGSEQPLSPRLVARNALLVAAALAAALPSGARPWVWIDAVTVTGGIAWLAALYAAAERLPARARALSGRS
jgi:hypothetical protein